MRRSSLPLNALRFFEAACRQRSFTRAAEELHVSHAAVSHQIRSLEELVGKKLFHRKNHGVQPTDTAEAMLPAMTDAFDRMEETMAFLIDGNSETNIRVTTTATFASMWLIPRLKGFRSKFPEIDVQIMPSIDIVNIMEDEADFAIRCGQPPWGKAESEFLLPIHLVPVCSPQLLEKPGVSITRDTIFDFQWIHSDAPDRPVGEEWRMWCEGVGLGVPATAAGSIVHDPSLGLQAAVNGIGIAIGYEELIQEYLSDGRLIKPIDVSVKHESSYHIVWNKKQTSGTRFDHFINWIKQEV